MRFSFLREISLSLRYNVLLGEVISTLFIHSTFVYKCVRSLTHPVLLDSTLSASSVDTGRSTLPSFLVVDCRRCVLVLLEWSGTVVEAPLSDVNVCPENACGNRCTMFVL